MIAQAKPSMNTHALIYGLLCWLIALPAWSSYAIYVGKNLTADGSVMIGGSGDEVSSHWLEVVPAATHSKDAAITVGITDAAFMPGKFMEIPQTAETYRYLTMNYSEYEGFPQCGGTAFAALAGVTLPADRVYDGVDISRVLLLAAFNEFYYMTIFKISTR